MIDLLKEYTEKRIDLLKLEVAEKSSFTAGKLLFLMVIFTALSFFIIMINIGIGLLIGSYLGNYAYGILIVAGFYLMVFFLLMINGKKIRNNFANQFIKFIHK